MQRRDFLGAVAALGAGAASMTTTAARAALHWPAGPVTLIVPFPPEEGADAFARPLARVLAKRLGQPVLIDNRPGAGGTVGAGIAARAAPDGLSFLVGAVHHAIAPSMYRDLDYDIEEDFAPVAMLASVPQVIVVNPGRIIARDLRGLIDTLRENPGRINFASAGSGTLLHLAGELFANLAEIRLVHVPHRGVRPALRDLIAGQVEMMFDALGSSAPFIRSGRLRAIAVASAHRAPGFADIPTAAEAGLPGYEVSTWYALFAPRGTPAEVLHRMRDEVVQAMRTRELANIWTGRGALADDRTSEQIAALMHAEIRRWAEIVAASGARPD